MAILAAFRLWMLSIQRLAVLGSVYDDLLFYRQAKSIAAFHWLGPYDSLLLTKGPGYPLWLAALSLLHVPLLLGQQLFGIFACAMLVLAIAPVLKSNAARLFVFTFLLMNPIAAGGWREWVLLRDSIYPDQCLLLAALLIGFLTRLDRGPWTRARWLVPAGLCMGWIYISREEGMWLAPFVAAVLGTAAWKLWRQRPALGRWAWLPVPAIPAAFMALVILPVCLLNAHFYGMFGVVDLKDPNFVHAMGALQRVAPSTWLRTVPVRRETWQKISDVSPAFAKLKPILDGPLGSAWAATSADKIPALQGTREIAGGWWVWAFRAAADTAGEHKDAQTAHQFYGRMADEVNAALTAGKLPAGPSLGAGLSVPWRWQYLPVMGQQLPAHLAELFSMANETPGLPFRSNADDEQLAQTTAFVHQRVLGNTPADETAALARAQRSPRLKLLNALHALYTKLGPILAALAAIIFCVLALRRDSRRRCWPLLAALLGIATAAALRTALLLFIDIALFPARSVRYTSATEMYVLLAEALCLGIALTWAIEWARARKKPAPELR